VPAWDFAYKRNHKGKELVIVPLIVREGGLPIKGSSSLLLISKNGKNEFQTQIAKVTGDARYMNAKNFKLGDNDFDGIVIIEDLSGNFIEGEAYENGKKVGVLQSNKTDKNNKTKLLSKATTGSFVTIITHKYTRVCSDYGCDTHYAGSESYTIWVESLEEAEPYYGTFYTNGGGGNGGSGSGGGGVEPCNLDNPDCFDSGSTILIEVVEPADRLCIDSFNGFQGGSQNSFWHANVNGLTFEKNPTANIFNAYFSLTNGISDLAMNTPHDGSVLRVTYSPLEFLQATLPELFRNGDIYSRMENGQKYWYFTKYGAQRIAQWSSNMAAGEVYLSVPSPEINPATKGQFVTYAERYLRSILPGSRVTEALNPNAPNTSASYSKTCK
jgi:hypothetical protein